MQILRSQGYTHVQNAGGMQQWMAANRPLKIR
jgi:rhodanese-related sulfurtransferase